MNKGKAEIKAKAPEQSGPAPISVPGATWDPADPSHNNNADQPVIASPKVIPHNSTPFAGTHGGIHEGAGESRPMFSSSLKE